MKNLFILVLLFFAISSYAQQDTCLWLKTNAEWCYAEWANNSNNDIIQIRILGDTLIENRLCSEMYLFHEGVLVEQSKLICYYDEQSQEVYFNEDDAFKLLYSFSSNLLVGDTVEYFLPSNFVYYDISSTSGSFEPTEESYRYTYQGEEVIELPSGESLRMLITTPAVLNVDYTRFFYGRIIEGIGPRSGFLGKGPKQLTSGFGPFFRNFESSDLTYIVQEGCLVTSVQDIDIASIQVFPNPISNILNIQSDQGDILRVRLYSSLGQIMLDQSVHNTEIEISVNGFTPGIYWLDVALLNGSRYREKVLVLDRE